jgi:hypothetical protein
MAAGKTVNYARVTDFQCERTGQISDVVAKETAKETSSESFNPKRLFPRGNEKFIARRSHAISATQSGCVAFNSFLLSRFGKGTMSTQSCSPILAWQAVERTSRCCYVVADDSAQDRKAGFSEIDIRQIRNRFRYFCHIPSYNLPSKHRSSKTVETVTSLIFNARDALRESRDLHHRQRTAFDR